jgi:ParB-like chromosome segregation protein Spo0J
MNLIELPLKSLIQTPWNYKSNSPELREKLKANILKNDQIENIIVRELSGGAYEIVNGNHRYDVMKELGYKTVVCINLGSISTQQAMRIAIETNETTFQTDEFKLMEAIKDITAEFDAELIAQSTKFSKEEIENYQSMFDFDWAEVAGPAPINNDHSQSFEQVGEAKQHTHTCKQCGYQW